MKIVIGIFVIFIVLSTFLQKLMEAYIEIKKNVSMAKIRTLEKKIAELTKQKKQEDLKISNVVFEFNNKESRANVHFTVGRGIFCFPITNGGTSDDQENITIEHKK